MTLFSSQGCHVLSVVGMFIERFPSVGVFSVSSAVVLKCLSTILNGLPNHTFSSLVTLLASPFHIKRLPSPPDSVGNTRTSPSLPISDKLPTSMAFKCSPDSICSFVQNSFSVMEPSPPTKFSILGKIKV